MVCSCLSCLCRFRPCRDFRRNYLCDIVANFVVGLRLGRCHLNIRAFLSVLVPDFPIVFEWISPKSSWFSKFWHFSLQQISGAEAFSMISLWITKILLWLSHLYWWVCRRGQESSTYFAELSLLWQRKHWQSNCSCWALVWRSFERQRLKKLTANTHPQMTPPPCPTSSIPRNLLRPSQEGGCFKGPIFTTHTVSAFFCCFEMPIFRAYGIGDPSSYQGAHPSLRGVSDRANFHAKACFCLSSFFGVLQC